MTDKPKYICAYCRNKVVCHSDGRKGCSTQGCKKFNMWLNIHDVVTVLEDTEPKKEEKNIDWFNINRMFS